MDRQIGIAAMMLRNGLMLFSLSLAGCAASVERPVSQPDPSVGFAWATFDAHGISASGAVGMADRSTNRPISIEDPVRIASISKLLVGFAVMRLVESGEVKLDDDVSALLGWKLRNPSYPDAPITLRMLLSHTSSLKDDGLNYVVPLGRQLSAVTETSEAFDAEHAPGRFFRYSNLNFPVIASVLERATGERFDRLMQWHVLSPLRLDACFNWSTCSDDVVARAIILYRLDGNAELDDLRGKRPDCPFVLVANEPCAIADYVLGSNGAIFSPQGGLRISIRDLVSVGQLLINQGRFGDTQFLSKQSIGALQRPAWRFDGENGQTDNGFYCTYGLATQILPTDVAGCADQLLSDVTLSGHAGDAYGLRSGLWVDMSKGVGIAYFAVNNGDDPVKGVSAYRAVEELLAANLLE